MPTDDIPKDPALALARKIAEALRNNGYYSAAELKAARSIFLPFITEALAEQEAYGVQLIQTLGDKWAKAHADERRRADESEQRLEKLTEERDRVVACNGTLTDAMLAANRERDASQAALREAVGLVEQIQDALITEINRPDPSGKAPDGKWITYTSGERTGMRIALATIHTILDLASPSVAALSGVPPAAEDDR